MCGEKIEKQSNPKLMNLLEKSLLKHLVLMNIRQDFKMVKQVLIKHDKTETF